MNHYEILEDLYRTNPELFGGRTPALPSLDEIESTVDGLGDCPWLQHQAA